MARPVGSKNKIPRKSITDFDLAAQVRTLALSEIKKVLLKEPEDNGELAFQRALILCLARNVLPKVTEIKPHSDNNGFSFSVVTYAQTALNGPKMPAIESKEVEMTDTQADEARKVQRDAQSLMYATGVVLDATTDDEQ